ncbi:Glycosyltransferase involved in cell wall bisynthesis [Onishia taeanensis]|uniref:Glycosyltransferase involved in cell wall bisynthesis n=1 Tax=Onishia taeanensis TaxID=284577 RepID=A0A1G7QKV7_9GAMM|nr:glycosyltransferase family 4 protein [Halomonas taeanensis]SDF99153.1 Glycosyltransferase involved in cell wall bisynthesis [Halomonas taeanensis]
MKCVFLANSAWYLKNFRLGTLRSFSHRSDVVCVFPVGNDDRLLDDEFSVSRITMQAAGKNPIRELQALYSLWRAFRLHNPDVVYSFNPKTNLYALFVCWMLRIPCVPNVSGVGVASQLRGPLGVIYDLLAGFSYRRATHVYFQNRDDYNTFIKRGWVLPEKAELIPGSGVDLSRFQSTPRQCGPLRFLMAARLIKQKGVIEYLEAAQALLDEGFQVEFWLAGVSDNSSRAVDSQLIEAFAKQPGIEFCGHVEDMPAILSQVDCVVLPSYYPEGIPRSLIEAAAAGKVIITTDTPGCRDIVDRERNGFLIPPESVKGLSDAMKHIISLSPESLSEMKAASRAFAESRFDENIVIKSYVESAERIASE